MATQMRQMVEAAPSVRGSEATGAHIQRQMAAIFLMATGWGWTASNFAQPINTPWGPIADLIHVLPLAVLLPLGLRLVGAAFAGNMARGARNGITAVALYGIIGCAVMVVLGAINPDPNSVGVHTFEDWMPVIVLNAGTLLWIGGLLFDRRSAQR